MRFVHYFEHNLDHFNFVQDKTFKQRYLYTDQYWDENGPRYYGESMPFGSSSFNHDKVGYLTAEQASADFAVLVTELKIQFKAKKVKSLLLVEGWIHTSFTKLGDYPYLTNFLVQLPGYPVAYKMMAYASSKLQGLVEVTAWFTVEPMGHCLALIQTLSTLNVLISPGQKGTRSHERASNPQDPPTVTQARQQELDLIRKFIQ
ncbi:hypothetical protein ACROYT_G043603 [Oculina patagonica]